MLQLLRAAIEPSGLPFSVAMGLVVLYWLAAPVGGTDAECLDRRPRRRPPGGGDAPSARPRRGAWPSQLAALPVMAWATLIASPLWLAMVPLAAVVNPYGRWHRAAAVTVAALAAAAAAVRWLGPPLGRWYVRSTRPAGAAAPAVRYCRILSVQLASGQRGRAERVAPPTGAPAASDPAASDPARAADDNAGGERIDVIAGDGAFLRQGQLARIDGYDEHHRAYVVRPAEGQPWRCGPDGPGEAAAGADKS